MKKILISIAAVLSISSYAYDTNMDSKALKETVEKLNCEKDLKTCRYLAVAEMKAVIDICFKDEKSFEREVINKVFNNWIVFEDEELKNAINDDNKLIKMMKKEVKNYFNSIPSYEENIECSRIVMLTDQIKPEYGAQITSQLMQNIKGESYFQTDEAKKRKEENRKWLEDVFESK